MSKLKHINDIMGRGQTEYKHMRSQSMGWAVSKKDVIFM